MDEKEISSQGLSLLQGALLVNKYPSVAEYEALEGASGLKVSEIRKWFSRNRVRDRQRKKTMEQEAKPKTGTAEGKITFESQTFIRDNRTSLQVESSSLETPEYSEQFGAATESPLQDQITGQDSAKEVKSHLLSEGQKKRLRKEYKGKRVSQEELINIAKRCKVSKWQIRCLLADMRKEERKENRLKEQDNIVIKSQEINELLQGVNDKIMTADYMTNLTYVSCEIGKQLGWSNLKRLTDNNTTRHLILQAKDNLMLGLAQITSQISSLAGVHKVVLCQIASGVRVLQEIGKPYTLRECARFEHCLFHFLDRGLPEGVETQHNPKYPETHWWWGFVKLRNRPT